ncbi:OmpH family outer membrane protein [Yoonia sediminilitoris]|uniref:Periplasmic chaperone for outer membrane proteins Skp n=1 Tax=Yoonia sediminilitoris TaxID=1286148 RepID=A0A2T6KS27_9RHOB|nr:OmpH family outer membrane protein [Yoonia sediminilitoris]PUB19364.1 periplasmic chaperone for outer membrane proteins Skp [Yoonia sediminilitoris]RCW99532.1 periplasmic chaperone for outer membrane proteins Skp [Yoonia sediminilitoris]
MRWLFAIVVCFGLTTLSAVAQQPSHDVLIIDSDQIYIQSLYGKRIEAELAEEVAAVRAENDRIIATLREEELSLTARRPDMDPKAFREEAAAFDAKVEEVRSARVAKSSEVQQRQINARAEFDRRVQTIIANLLFERGAAIVIDISDAVVWVRSANITDDVIARIDRELGDGLPQ